jgi:hypothetical protein
MVEEATERFPPKKLAILTLVSEAGANKSAEQRVRLVRLALEFRMILTGEEKRVVAQLDQFRERTVG